MAAGRGYGVRTEDCVSMANWARRCFDRALAFKRISLECKAAVDRAEVGGAREAVARNRQADRRCIGGGDWGRRPGKDRSVVVRKTKGKKIGLPMFEVLSDELTQGPGVLPNRGKKQVVKRDRGGHVGETRDLPPAFCNSFIGAQQLKMVRS